MTDPSPNPGSPLPEVRSFQPQDQPHITRLYDQGLLNGQIAPNDTGADIDNPLEAYFDEPRHHFWVAFHPGHDPIGMIAVGSDEDHTAEIRRLRVHPDHQHTPVADLLIDTALNHCKNHGYLKIRLDTRYEKTAALDHFNRIGFQHTRTRTAPGKEVLEFYLDLYRQADGEPDPHH
ncbi:MAG: GNAT family N-acetyltransferase [Planctomycetota bacterium]